MRVIEGTKVDLISPFPPSQADRVWRWMCCYKNIINHDGSPQTEQEFVEHFNQIVNHVTSYGVIDKEGQLGLPHEAPLVAFVAFEPQTEWNSYIHIASSRRCWGTFFIDEGITLALDDMFAANPKLLRVSAMVMKNNKPVHSLAKRLGFAFEGRLPDFVAQRGEPKTIVHYGITRRRWFENRPFTSQSSDSLVFTSSSSE
jgi:RimJ/RimL family protein N-acetyltransferase